MATRRLGSFDSDNVVFELDYNATTLRVTALRCINKTGQLAYGELVQTLRVDANSTVGRKAGILFLSGTTEIAISTSNALKLQMVLDARGRLDGVEGRFVWPASIA